MKNQQESWKMFEKTGDPMMYLRYKKETRPSEALPPTPPQTF